MSEPGHDRTWWGAGRARLVDRRPVHDRIGVLRTRLGARDHRQPGRRERLCGRGRQRQVRETRSHARQVGEARSAARPVGEARSDARRSKRLKSRPSSRARRGPGPGDRRTSAVRSIRTPAAGRWSVGSEVGLQCGARAVSGIVCATYPGAEAEGRSEMIPTKRLRSTDCVRDGLRGAQGLLPGSAT